MRFTATIETDEDGVYVASINELKGVHTQGKDLPEALRHLAEAVEVHHLSMFKEKGT